MAGFKISTVTGVWGKKLGKEEVEVELSEWELHSLMKACHHWNKKLYRKLKSELVNEAIKEGFEISFNLPDTKIRCPKCKKVIKI